MKFVIQVLIMVPIILGIAGFLLPDLVVGESLLNKAGFWALVGTLFSYLGFVFSLFAVLEVRALTQRYFTKQRLPEIKKRIDAIAKDVYDFGEKDYSDIRSQKFMSEISVMIRQVKKTKVRDLVSVAKRLERSHAAIKSQFKNQSDLEGLANASDSFWELHGVMTELSDEMDEYNKGAIATL